MLGEIFNRITMIEIPVFASLFSLLFKQRKDTENAIGVCKDALSDFKVHVARNYASASALKDVENRLTEYLLRIEKKIDRLEDTRNVR